MKNKILGKRYATALLDLAAADAAKIESYGNELSAFASALAQVPELRKVMTVPLYGRELRRSALDKICDASGASAEIQGFFRVLLEKNRFDQFDAIVESYRELVDERKGCVHGTVASATPLSPDQQQKVAAALGKKLGKDVVLTTTVEPELIGGIRAQIGSTVIDGSIRSQLSQIRDRIVKG